MKASVLILIVGLLAAVCDAVKKEGFQEDFEFVEDGKDRTSTVSGDRKTWLLDSNNALCGLLRCARREICLLQDRFTAVCVDKAEVTHNGDKIVQLSDATDSSGEHLTKSWDALEDYEDEDDEDYDDDDEDDDDFNENDEAGDNNDDEDDEEDYDSTVPEPIGNEQHLNRRPFAEKQCTTCPVVRPVFLCGSDNRTYSSLCRLHYHNCIHDASVRIACKGFCPCKDPSTKKERQRERISSFLTKLNSTKETYSSTPNPSSSSSSSSTSSSSSFDSSSSSSSSKGGITKEDKKSGRNSNRNNNNNSHSGNNRREKHSRDNTYNKSNNRVHSRFNKVKNNKYYNKEKQFKKNYKYGKDGFRKNEKYNRRQWPWPSTNEATHKSTNTVWGPNECTQDALEAMGNRMLDWFSVIMADSRSRSNSANKVPASAPSWCKPEVSWMLGHLDTDNDGQLSVKELYQLEHDDHERCIKPFIDRCDLDRDIFLSSREWCKCFDKSERPCAALRKQSKGLLGGYIPECDSEGYYQPTQCHSGAGLCWCVDRHGVELPNTRTRKTPNCDAIINRESMSNHVDDDAEDGDDFLDTVEGSADMPMVI